MIYTPVLQVRLASPAVEISLMETTSPAGAAECMYHVWAAGSMTTDPALQIRPGGMITRRHVTGNLQPVQVQLTQCILLGP